MATPIEQLQAAIQRATYPQLIQRYACDVLWHFVGSKNKNDEECYQILKSILMTGLKLSTNAAEFIYRDKKTSEPIKGYGYPICCLADIPLKDLPLHSSKYGQYAIGFHKRSAVLNHFNPLLYVNQYAHFFHDFRELSEEVLAGLKQGPPDILEKYERMLLYLGSVSKSGFLDLPILNDEVLDKSQVNNYYYEREWRSIYSWSFNKDDVALIIMPRQRIRKFLEEWNGNADFRLNDETPILPFDMITAI